MVLPKDLDSKTNICIHVYSYMYSLRPRSGGGLKALAEISAKNVSFF